MILPVHRVVLSQNGTKTKGKGALFTALKRLVG